MTRDRHHYKFQYDRENRAEISAYNARRYATHAESIRERMRAQRQTAAYRLRNRARWHRDKLKRAWLKWTSTMAAGRGR